MKWYGIQKSNIILKMCLSLFHVKRKLLVSIVSCNLHLLSLIVLYTYFVATFGTSVKGVNDYILHRTIHA